MPAPSTTTPEAVMIDDVLNEAVVQIAVKNGELHLYPQRISDTVVYHVTDENLASPARPHMVRWVVTGLESGQKIQIEAKSEKGMFASDSFSIPFGCNTVCSGPAKLPAGGRGRERHWKYDLVLLTPGKKEKRIDPVIVVKDDP